jgi:hypothetical protein
MTAHFPGLLKAYKTKVGGVKLVVCPQISPFMRMHINNLPYSYHGTCISMEKKVAGLS